MKAKNITLAIMFMVLSGVSYAGTDLVTASAGAVPGMSITAVSDNAASSVPSTPDVSTSAAISSVSYDGVWALGFNLKRRSMRGEEGLALRRAICAAIDRKAIAMDIMGSARVPDSIIPPGMTGYLPGLITPDASERSVTGARLVLLCTDGDKTLEAVAVMVQDCRAIGVELALVTLNYAEQLSFEESLKVGSYDLFLVGYKTQDGSTAELLRELFSSGGSANFFGLADARLDALLQSTTADEKVYNDVQQDIWERRVMLPIFYIEKY